MPQVAIPLCVLLSTVGRKTPEAVSGRQKRANWHVPSPMPQRPSPTPSGPQTTHLAVGNSQDCTGFGHHGLAEGPWGRSGLTPSFHRGRKAFRVFRVERQRTACPSPAVWVWSCRGYGDTRIPSPSPVPTGLLSPGTVLELSRGRTVEGRACHCVLPGTGLKMPCNYSGCELRLQADLVHWVYLACLAFPPPPFASPPRKSSVKFRPRFSLAVTKCHLQCVCHCWWRCLDQRHEAGQLIAFPSRETPE